MTEEQRYAAVQAQMKEISDRAVEFGNPVISLLSAMLHAEMYARNERAHMRYEARTDFVRTLQARILKGNER